jgi:DNA-binding response OmpR family regulator
VRLHGGSIVAESTLGQGTSFHLFLPLAEEAFRVQEPARATVPLGLATSVLMVEDDGAIAAGIAVLLEEEGIHVQIATTGREALEMLASRCPDAVLLDLGLPDMDGIAVYESIAADHPDLAVIFATGNHDVAILDPYLREGQVVTLSKPYEFSELLDRLGAVVRAPSPG